MKQRSHLSIKAFRTLLLAVATLSLVACSGRTSDDHKRGEMRAQRYAQGFTVEHLEDCRRVTVRDPWDTTAVLRTYILHDKATSIDAALYPDATIIAVPIERTALLYSTHVSMLESLGVERAVCAVAEPEYMNFDYIQTGLADGSIRDIGSSMQVNVEPLVASRPHAIIVSPFPNSGYGTLEKVGVPLIECAEYMESTPMGRVEWIKFVALFFDLEQRADSLFEEVDQRYLAAQRLIPEGDRPTLLAERRYGGVWDVSGGNSYMAQLYRAAGAHYLWEDDPSSGALSLSFEAVFAKAQHADYWLMKYNIGGDRMTYRGLAQEYAPYAQFDAWKKHRVIGCNTATNHYYERGIMEPDVVLMDLISILYPDLMPDHTLRYLELLPPDEE